MQERRRKSLLQGEIRMSGTDSTTIAGYLLRSLKAAGAHHVFGVPGDYILRFYEEMSKSPIRHVGTTREDTAAFAADGYARCQGIGALAITYGVGALNVVNAVAGAHAESSPVVVISGAPGVREQREDPLLHHRFGPFTFQREIFDRITCASTVLDDPVTAFRQIDRTLAAAPPAVIARVAVHRRGVQDAVVDLFDRGRLPIAATRTGKWVIGERYPD